MAMIEPKVKHSPSDLTDEEWTRIAPLLPTPVPCGYRPIRIAIDQTGMGEPIVEAAQRRYGASTVEGILFTGRRKLELATALKERLQDRTLRILAGDRALRADLHAVSRVAGPTGAPRLLADGETDGHADRFWAAALACAAAKSVPAPISYRPVGLPRRRGAAEDGDDPAPRGWEAYAPRARLRDGAPW